MTQRTPRKALASMTSDRTILGMQSWLVVIAIMSGIGPLTIDLYLPAFPMIEAGFRQSGAEGTMAAYLIGMACGQLVYGPLSDRFGRKPPLYFGFTIYIVGSLCCVFAGSMQMLMVGRVIQALGGSSGMPTGRAIVRDRCQPEEAARVFSTLMTVISVAPIIAPVAGGFVVSAWGWRATFFIQAALGGVVLLCVHFFLTETLDTADSRQLSFGHVLRNYAALFGNWPFMMYALIGGFSLAAVFAYISGAPKVLPAMFGVSPATFGWLIGLNGIAFFIASRLNARALRKRKSHDILRRLIWWPSLCGAMLIALGAIDLWVADIPLFAVLFGQFLFFVTTVRVLPHAAALALATRERDVGTAAALMGSLQSFVGVVVGVAVTLLNDGSLIPLGVIMTLCVIACGLLHLTKRS